MRRFLFHCMFEGQARLIRSKYARRTPLATMYDCPPVLKCFEIACFTNLNPKPYPEHMRKGASKTQHDQLQWHPWWLVCYFLFELWIYGRLEPETEARCICLPTNLFCARAAYRSISNNWLDASHQGWLCLLLAVGLLWHDAIGEHEHGNITKSLRKGLCTTCDAWNSM